MSYAIDKGAKLTMSNEYNDIWMEDKPFVLKKTSRKYVSFFPYGGDVDGFCVKGLKYSADNVVLSCKLVQASSNEFVDCETAEITFNSGRVLVMLCDDKV